MASLKDIRRRIGSVKNTQQITKAMKMVSAAKLRRAQELITGARPFADKVEELSSRILSELQKNQTSESKLIHPLLRQKPAVEETEKPRAYVVAISSDKGLCGAYNTNVIKMAFRHVATLKETHDVKVICVGRKVSEAMRKRGIHAELVPSFWSEPLTQTRVASITKTWIEDFVTGKVDKIDFVYTEFKSAISLIARDRTILPLEVSVEAASEEAESASKDYVFKPSREELLAGLLPKQVVLQMYRCFADALASEFGARMTSMDNATKNASEMIGDLTLLANRVRQASITTELMEIVGGAEALKG
ncbi:MAG: ATP synthase F1 subunit gamma [Bdellovibrionota bacterium]